MAAEQKRCPRCAEMVQEAAVACRHCGFDFRMGYVPPMPVVQRRTNGFAIASMVLGILWLWWVGSILALVFGYIAKRQIDASGGAEEGRGMAIAGIVLGWVGVGFLTLIITAALVSTSSSL